MRRLLPREPSLRWLAVGNLVNMTGTGASLAALVVYLAYVKHLPLPEATSILTAAGLIGVLGAVPVGHLSDRYGARRTAVVAELVCALAVIALLPLTAPWLLAAALAVRQLAVSGNTVARAALMGRLVTSAQRVELRAYQRSVSNVGFAVGALLAGVAIGRGGAGALYALLLFDALTFVFAAYATTRLPRSADTILAAANGAASTTPPQARVVLPDYSYVSAAVLNAGHALNLAVVSVGLPLWIVYLSPLPSWAASLALGLNTVLIVLLQVPLSRHARELSQASRTLAVAGLLTAVGCAALGAGSSAGVGLGWVAFLLACSALAVGEVLGSAAGWALSYDLAPDHLVGRYQGVWQLTADGVTKAAGPAIMGAAVGAGSLGLGALAAAFGVLAGVTPVSISQILRARAGERVPRSEALAGAHDRPVRPRRSRRSS